MLEGACMAGISFNLTGTAIVHALSFILSEEWHVPHGTACAFTLEDALLLNAADPATRVKLAEVGRAIFGEGLPMEQVYRLHSRIVGLKKKFGLPASFADLGVTLGGKELDALFEKSLEDPKMKNNIVPVDMPVVSKILAAKCR